MSTSTPIDNIKLPANILFCGMTNSGKTYCFRQLYTLYWKKQIKLTYVISTTAEYSGDYKTIVKDRYILSDMSLANGKIAEIRRFCESQRKKGKNYPVMLVIDDCLGVINFNTPEFANLFAISRHINLTIVLMMQNLTKFMQPALRNNLSYIYINKLSDSNLKCLYELCDCWETYGDMRLFLRDNCVNYQTIMIDKKSIEYVEPFVFKAG